jgi:ubiquinone/menaquinone biosynthesis C-methylase UbiE
MAEDVMHKEIDLPMNQSWRDSYKEYSAAGPPIPDYLESNYWWAYLHPKSVRFFEHQWIVNAILWGHYNQLKHSALAEFGSEVSGRTLQVACVYGSLTPALAERQATDARLDVVDVAPIQLENLWRKVNKRNDVFLSCQDASSLSFEEGTFDQVLFFFLLHELPLEVRKKTIKEAMRVVKPGGKVIFVDYHRPVWQHPHRYLMQPVLKYLEPFALDLWNTEIVDWVEPDVQPKEIRKKTYFGGLYQKVVMEM